MAQEKHHPLAHPPKTIRQHELGAKNRIQAPCAECARETNHQRLLTVSKDYNGPYRTTIKPDEVMYEVIQCQGCDSVSMIHRVGGDKYGGWDVEYYPSRVARRFPPWIDDLSDEDIGGPNGASLANLLKEIYQAVRGHQYKLSAMGVRALLEQVMIQKVDDQGSFLKNLDYFHRLGYISLMQRDSVSATLEAGHAAMHRFFTPDQSDLSTLLDVTESVLSSVYIHPKTSSKVADKVPKRAARSKAGKET